MTRPRIGQLGLLAMFFAMWGCSSHVAAHPDPCATTVRSLVSKLPHLRALLSGARSSPASLDSDNQHFLVEPSRSLPRFSPEKSLERPNPTLHDVRPIRAHLGRLASDPAHFETPALGDITVRRAGATQSPGAIEEGVVLYPDALGGADALVVSKLDGIEELLVAHSPEAHIRYVLGLPPGARLRSHDSQGFAEVLDDTGHARLRIWANRAWDATGAEVALEMHTSADEITLTVVGLAKWPVLVDPVFTGTGKMLSSKQGHTATLLDDGQVLVTGGENKEKTFNLAEIYDPSTGTFTATVSGMISARKYHTATKLLDGRVLIAGGTHVQSAELFDPSNGEFTATPAMVSPRSFHTETLLDDGTVLLAGGVAVSNPLDTAEVFSPTSGQFTPLSSHLSTVRAAHVASKLDNGKVLLAGGGNASADLFDPSTRTFSTIGSNLSASRTQATATALETGEVVVAGGVTSSGTLRSVDRFDPSTGVFSPTQQGLIQPRSRHTATRVDGGQILLAGGENSESRASDTAELFDPATGELSAAASRLSSERAGHTATRLKNGKVLLTGGVDAYINFLDTAEEYAPNTGELSISRMTQQRLGHSATKLDNGDVILVGGIDSTVLGTAMTSTAEVFQASPRMFQRSRLASLIPLASHTATKLDDGRILFAGGMNGESVVDTAQIYDPHPGVFGFTNSPLNAGRSGHTATKLDSGRILIAGGTSNVETLGVAEEFDPTTGTFTPTQSNMIQKRSRHCAIKLKGGKVLIAGGTSGFDELQSVELYDPETRSFSALGAQLSTARYARTATLLDDGRVLFAGGQPLPDVYPIDELFDPNTGSFSQTATNLIHLRWAHSATKLENGKVLIAGGRNSDYALDTAEQFDPSTGVFTPLSSKMSITRSSHTETLLDNGWVMLTGGVSSSFDVRDTVEYYDPVSSTFPLSFLKLAVTGSTLSETQDGHLLLAGNDTAGSHAVIVSSGPAMKDMPGAVDRAYHSATLIDDGSLLFVGGINATQVYLDTFDAVTSDGLAHKSGKLASPRAFHSATKLPDGRVFVAGGENLDGPVLSTELIDPRNPEQVSIGPTVKARSRHSAVLLVDGRVLLVGGTSLEGDVLTAEVFDPSTSTVLGIGQANVGAKVTSAFLGGANIVTTPNRVIDQGVIFSGANKSVRFDAGSSGFFDLALEAGSQLITLSNGDVLACKDVCRFLSSSSSTSGDAGGPRLQSADLLKAWGTRSFGGTGPRDDRQWIGTGETFGVSTKPPSLSPLVKTSWTTGEAGSVEGTGWPVDATPSSSLSDRVVLAWRPIDSVGPPMVIPAQHWRDGSVDFVVPTTVYTGPGWLYVLVDGVPSDGVLMSISSASEGLACEVGGHCASGYCVDGVCCNRDCVDGCLACSAEKKGQGHDGYCDAIVKGKSPRFGCLNPDNTTCGFTQSCNGAGSCELPGVEKECDGPDFRCQAGVCAPAPSNSCSDNGEQLISVTGNRSCAPFRCFSDACLTTCASHGDCAPGHACNVESRCVPASSVTDTSDPGGCSAGNSGRAGSHWALMTLAILKLVRSVRRARRDHSEPEATTISPPTTASPGSSETGCSTR